MAKRGPKVQPEYERYECAGTVPAIYLLEVGKAVKVGQSQRPCSRLGNLHREYARTGECIGRFAVIPVAGRSRSGLHAVERKCIDALAFVATNLPARREYFTGITYEQALRIVQDALSA